MSVLLGMASGYPKLMCAEAASSVARSSYLTFSVLLNLLSNGDLIIGKLYYEKTEHNPQLRDEFRGRFNNHCLKLGVNGLA